jgi:hypothetical protein
MPELLSKLAELSVIGVLCSVVHVPASHCNRAGEHVFDGHPMCVVGGVTGYDRQQHTERHTEKHKHSKLSYRPGQTLATDLHTAWQHKQQ